MTKELQTSAFIAIVGRPNVGKSSLMNRILGQKVAIVSDKPQTTRTRIMGILTQGGMQLVFIDTPGLHRPKTKLGENMVKAVGDSVGDVDAALLVIDAADMNGDMTPSKADMELIERFRRSKIPAVLAINKIDLVHEREKILKIILNYTKEFDFAAVVPLSAKSGDGVPALLDELGKFAAEGPHFFADDELTDQSERTIAAEIIREKLLYSLDKEVPHGIAVGIEKFADRKTGSGEDIIDIEATIYCESDSHKGIVIGKGGAMLKSVSTRARQDMERFFDCKVNLRCWVKAKEDWRNRSGIIHSFGLD
jgi:GTP-binding protein Era